MAEKSSDYAIAMSRAKDEDEKDTLTRRESRTPPDDDMYELVEYLLNTPQADMEYEIARCRPLLNPAFFVVLDTLMGSERFAAKPDQDRLDELDMLRKFVEDTSKMVDVAVNRMASASERVKRLLTSPDKRQCILDMASNNEIDAAVIFLLQQNIDAARAAEQEDAAKFMEKVKTAAAKYVLSSMPAPPPAPPAPVPTPATERMAAQLQPAPLPAPPAAKSNIALPGQAPAPAAPRRIVLPGQSAPPTTQRKLEL
jgi:hypothetical protein